VKRGEKEKKTTSEICGDGRVLHSGLFFIAGAQLLGRKRYKLVADK
jgi:hypothetical protein